MPKTNQTNTPVTVIDDSGEALTQQSKDLAQIDAMFGVDPLTYNREAYIERFNFVNNLGAKCWLESGRLLLVMKEHESRHGNWLETLKQIGIDKRLAQRQMQGAMRFDTTKLKQMAIDVGMTKALELVFLEDDLQDFAEGESVLGLTLDEVEKMSCAELRTEVRKLKKTKADDANATDQLLSDKNKKIDELTRKLNEVTSLEGKTEKQSILYNNFCNEINMCKLNVIDATSNLNHMIVALSESMHELHPDTHDLIAQFAANCVSEVTHMAGKLQYETGLYFNDLLNAHPTYEIDSVES